MRQEVCRAGVAVGWRNPNADQRGFEPRIERMNCENCGDTGEDRDNFSTCKRCKAGTPELEFTALRVEAMTWRETCAKQNYTIKVLLERAEKAEKERDEALAEVKKAEHQRAIAIRYAEESGANYTQAQEELGRLDAHVIVLESKVAKLREALEAMRSGLGDAGVLFVYLQGENTAADLIAAALKETK